MKLPEISRKIRILLIVIVLIFSSCSRKVVKVIENNDIKKKETVDTKTTSDPLLLAEEEATKEGRSILEIGRQMVFDEKAIIKGSCWDYIYEVYKRAGYATNKTTVYKSKKSGPYVDVDKIQPGDWLYYVNHSYGGVEHSGIFIYWKDFKNKIGVTLSYGGEHRNEPGRYREYDLRSVYNIIRPNE